MSSSLVEVAMVRYRCCIFCAVLHHAEGEVLAARAARLTSPLLLLSQSTSPTPVVEAMMCRRCCVRHKQPVAALSSPTGSYPWPPHC
ncbi:hypothetical protein PIB30_039200 [Stylosanthes scabra]|uniref:Secreted protein n=1 Tax=Stylosanthes scabra TaxID=79078 RepID=A0ABU6ZCY5_9FABA|nr:hypothetical protein [Stylosanthes scabra]